MKRKVYDELLKWKEQYSGKEALLLEGARRIGKSYIAEEFARNEYRSYILVDFSKIKREEKEIFDNYLGSDLDTFFRLLSLQRRTKLYPGESLIIFDEVQLYPKAREAVKALVADGRYSYLETGSLVSIRKNTRNILIPSEEKRLEMYPMDFEEFLWAVGEKELMDYIRECFEKGKPLSAALHRRAMLLLRTYVIVGGMPQAVLAWKESGDFEAVDHEKRRILELYRNDIYNYAGAQADKVVKIWDAIPGQLSKHEKRFSIGSVKKGARTRDYQSALFWLTESQVVNVCYGATEPSIGLKLSRDDAKYKLYLSDTGLLISHAFDEDPRSLDELCGKLMLGKLELNSGMLIENLVAQMLRSSGKKLYFYSRVDKEVKENTMEVDFLVRKPSVTSRHNICPIEVKSGSRYATVSLQRFASKFKDYQATQYVVHAGTFKEKDGIIYLPLYMAGLL